MLIKEELCGRMSSFDANIFINAEEWKDFLSRQVLTVESQWIHVYRTFGHFRVKWLFTSFAHFLLLDCLPFTYWRLRIFHTLWIHDYIGQFCISTMNYPRLTIEKVHLAYSLGVQSTELHSLSPGELSYPPHPCNIAAEHMHVWRRAYTDKQEVGERRGCPSDC